MELWELPQVKGYCPFAKDLAVRPGLHYFVDARGDSPTRLDFYIGH